MNGRPILGLLAIGALALVVSALGGGGEAAGAGRLPACPETWPEATGWHDGWYVIIDQDSNGNRHGRAYPASARYDVGYVPAAPWETCIVRIKGNPGVEQVVMSKERETFSGTSGNGSGGTGTPIVPGDNNNPTPTPDAHAHTNTHPDTAAAAGHLFHKPRGHSDRGPVGSADPDAQPGGSGRRRAVHCDARLRRRRHLRGGRRGQPQPPRLRSPRATLP